MSRSGEGAAWGGGQRSDSGSSAGGGFMVILVTAISPSSTYFLPAGESHCDAGRQCEVLRATMVDFIAAQKHDFAVRDAPSAAEKSFRRDFFAYDEKKMIELTCLMMLFVDRAQRGAE
jgi:hypothetical protein